MITTYIRNTGTYNGTGGVLLTKKGEVSYYYRDKAGRIFIFI